MQAEFLDFGSIRIRYYYINRGESLMVCFHGYDENGLSFEIMEQVFPPGCSLLAIDLPHHGETSWDSSTPFEVPVLWQIVTTICARHSLSIARIHLAGFSMGGRIALSLLQHHSRNIGQVILLAPDGLKENRWYRFATATLGGKAIFRFTVRHPGWLQFTLRVANKLRIINQSVFRFSWFYLRDQQMRRQLYKRWMSMRKLRPDIPLIKSLIRENKIPVLLIYGSFDRIMPADVAADFCKNTDQLCRVEILASGHQIMQVKNEPGLTRVFSTLKL